MKNFTHLSKLSLVFLFSFILFVTVNAQIHSTTTGGVWSDPDTWIGPVVPGAGNDVVINGTVNVNGDYACNDLTITSSGAVRNDYYSFTLTVYGDITNSGSILNYVNSFFLVPHGNIINNGSWTNSYTRPGGSATQTIQCLNGATFNGYEFLSFKTGGDIYFNTEVNFKNCNVDLNDIPSYIMANSTLKIEGGHFDRTALTGNGNTSVLLGVSFPYLYNITLTDLSLNGDLEINNGCSTHGTVINNGTIQNDYYPYNFVLYDDFINNGTINNYVNTLTLQIYGNFTNNNVVNNHAMDFYGDNHQFVSLQTGKTLSPTYWTSFKSSNQIEALTDLIFDHVKIDMNYDSLIMQNDGLISLSGDYFIEGNIYANSAKSGNLTYHCENSAYTDYCTFNNVTLTGLFKCGTDNYFYGMTYNNGIMENDYYDSWPKLYDTFINNGTIRNYVNSLFLNIYGDFVNNGDVDNQAMDFYGDTDQHLSLQSGKVFSPAYFTSVKPSGDFIANDDLYFEYVIINFDNRVLYLPDDGMISVRGGRLHQADIRDMNNGSGYLNLHMTESAYIDYSTVYNPEVLGIVDIGTDNTFIGDILVSDTIRNDYYNNTLVIDGNIINDGYIWNYVNSLTLTINGDVTNNGVWSCSSTYFDGANDQHVTCLNNNTFSGYQIYNNNTSGVIFFDNTVNLANCILKGEGNNFELSANSTLTMDNAYLTNANLTGNGETSVVHGTALPYLEYSTIEDVLFSGEWSIALDISMYGTIINDGLLMNEYYSRAIDMYADFINNGTIQNYVGNFTIMAHGNVTNNGIWEGHALDLYGSGDQVIGLAGGHTFSPDYFTSFKPSGNIIASADLDFDHTRINLENNMLIMPEGGRLSLINYYLYRANVSASTGRFNLHMSTSAYIHECSFTDVDITGTIDVNDDNDFYGTTINYGVIQNDYYNYNADFYGDIINLGTIQSYVNNLYVSAYADIENQGTWTNDYTQMLGTEDQTITLMNDHWIVGQLRMVSDVQVGPYQWYWNDWAIANPPYPEPAIISGENSSTLTWISPVTDWWAGTYKCWDGGTWSRNIYIESDHNYFVDLNLLLEGPFNGTDMNTDLNDMLPIAQPYDVYPWEYDGLESVPEIPNANVVDWVLVEFRDAPTVGAATPATSLGGQAAFILNDGSIVGLDGYSPLNIDYVVADQLFVGVWHRNHLPVFSEYGLAFDGLNYSYDFTTSADQAYGDNQADLGGGNYGMIAGDLDADGSIDMYDINLWKLSAGTKGYFMEDANMNTEIDNTDKNDLWYKNLWSTEIMP